MRCSAFILLLFACCTGAAQSADTLNRVDSPGKKQGYWIITGSMAKKPQYKPDAKVEEGRYADGKKSGAWTEYYPNGSKKREGIFLNNRPNGPLVFYSERGHVSEKGTWIGTRWTGDYWLYYENDTVVRQRLHFNSTGQRDGMQFHYHPNGVLWISCYHKNGKEEGWKMEYDTTGRLIIKQFYVGAVLNADSTKTYPPLPENWNEPVLHKQDKLSGQEWKQANVCSSYVLYNKDGKVGKKGTFRDYKLVDGQEYIYDEKGILVQIKNYKDGKYTSDAPLPE